jgi:hypothetical protein
MKEQAGCIKDHLQYHASRKLPLCHHRTDQYTSMMIWPEKGMQHHRTDQYTSMS